jgi:phenylalanyl-tRNA synthetase beta chain
MDLSMKWLGEFVKIDEMPMRDFTERMTMTGSKVEGWRTEGEDIENVVVGRILSVTKHPDADKLVVCSVDAGKGEPIQIVTGASNVFAGALVPVALSGSTLPGGVKIKSGKLRGVESNGMLCSIGELKLTKGDFPYAAEDGIFIIKEDCTPGEDIRKALGTDDTVVEFEITPNRPDCLSVIGLAREAAASFGKPLMLHEPKVKGCKAKTRDYIDAVIHEPSLCYRYCARAVKNVKIAPSPRWMRERLRASGVRPINNIVDITNYVCLEYGQPMHAFDYRFIKGGVINVRRAAKGEKITTLEGAEHQLDDSMLVIADSEKPVAVAGIMGGEYSGIMPDTDTIVFESAMFSGVSVRVTARRLGLRTESSARFEKGLDAQGTLAALNRACELAELIGAGEPACDWVDVDCTKYSPRTVELVPDWINKFLGTDIPEKFMADSLRSLDFKVDGRTITIPSYRGDVSHKADIAEEVARMYGYDRIPDELTIGSTTHGGLTSAQKFDRRVRDTLLACGLSEITTYSFISPKYYDKILMSADSPLRRSVKISNPLGEDTGIMRTTLMPSMLEVLARNYSARNMEAALFEQGTVYFPKSDGELPDEPQQTAIGMYGGGSDFYTLKGAVEELLRRSGITEYDVEAVTDDPSFHPGRCADILKDGQLIARLGEVHPKVQENYGMDTRVYYACVYTPALAGCAQLEHVYTPLPKFPATARDIAVTCNEEIPVLTLEKTIKSAAGKSLEKITLFDIYRGKQIPEGKKSVAFSISLRAADRTLTDAETERTMKKIVAALSQLGAELRA